MWNVIPKQNNKDGSGKKTGEAKFRTYVICAFLMLVSSGGAEVKAC